MLPFPGIYLHLSYLTWFTFNNAVKNAKKPETQNRWIGRRLEWSRWSLYYKACRLRFCFSVAACFGGALEGRGRLSAPECDQATEHVSERHFWTPTSLDTWIFSSYVIFWYDSFCVSSERYCFRYINENRSSQWISVIMIRTYVQILL